MFNLKLDDEKKVIRTVKAVAICKFSLWGESEGNGLN